MPIVQSIFQFVGFLLATAQVALLASVLDDIVAYNLTLWNCSLFAALLYFSYQYGLTIYYIALRAPRTNRQLNLVSLFAFVAIIPAYLLLGFNYGRNPVELFLYSMTNTSMELTRVVAVSALLYIAFSAARKPIYIGIGPLLLVALTYIATTLGVPAGHALYLCYLSIGGFIFVSGLSRWSQRISQSPDQLEQRAFAVLRYSFRNASLASLLRVLATVIVLAGNALQTLVFWPRAFLIMIAAVLLTPAPFWREVFSGRRDFAILRRRADDAPMALIDAITTLLVLAILYSVESKGILAEGPAQGAVWLMLVALCARYLQYALHPIAAQLRVRTNRPYLLFLGVVALEVLAIGAIGATVTADVPFPALQVDHLRAFRDALFRPSDWSRILLGEFPHSNILAANILMLLFSAFVLKSIFQFKDFRRTSDEVVKGVLSSLAVNDIRAAENAMKHAMATELGSRTTGLLIVEGALKLAKGDVEGCAEDIRRALAAERIDNIDQAVPYVMLNFCGLSVVKPSDASEIFEAGFKARLPDAYFALLLKSPSFTRYHGPTLLRLDVQDQSKLSEFLVSRPVTAKALAQRGELGFIGLAATAISDLVITDPLSKIALACNKLEALMSSFNPDKDPKLTLDQIKRWERDELPDMEFNLTLVSNIFECSTALLYLTVAAIILSATGASTASKVNGFAQTLRLSLARNRLLADQAAFSRIIQES